jgi:hypothetical protein
VSHAHAIAFIQDVVRQVAVLINKQISVEIVCLMRPVVVPDWIAKLEFAREKALLVERSWDVEFRGRADTEVDELIIDESRESERSKHLRLAKEPD